MTLKDIKYVTQKTVTAAKNYSEYRFMLQFVIQIFAMDISPKDSLLDVCSAVHISIYVSLQKREQKRNFLSVQKHEQAERKS